ncbi:MAG: cobalamin-independent methionine synthase II family protein [bacterium]|nr:cobalamin-independent methionine synthase II family protein [bacterium]MDE0353428.1 cobalamin-independent methionine synthase II family protein [bacterium]
MLGATKNRPLATTTTGGLPRPSWHTESLSGRPFSVAMAGRGFREQYRDLVAALVADQNQAGIDILVDGDARFDDDVAGRQWIAYPEERLAGLGPPELRSYPIHQGHQPGEFMYEVMETRMPRAVIGKVGPGPLEYDRIWQTAQASTDKPVKFGAISAQLLEASINNDFYPDRRRLVMDLSEIMNEEYHRLADAGCPVIQVEEPAIHGIAGTEPGTMLDAGFYVEAFNREVSGLRDKTEVWCHTCWGSPGAQRTRSQHFSYEAALPFLNELDVDVLTFEAKETSGEEIPMIASGIGPDKKIALGVVSHRTLQIEPPEEVAGLVRMALDHISPERLILSTDCGFGRQGMSRMHAFYKMVSLVRGVNLVRAELGLEEADVPTASPGLTTLD